MNKIELIDRAAVIADLKTQFAAVYKDTMLRPIMDDDPYVEVLAKSDARHMQLFLDGLEAYLMTRPAIDAAPVRRGEWVMIDEYCNHAKTYECTACRGAVELDCYTRCCDYDFCPNCGADMRKEDTHEPEDGRDREELERLLG